MPTFEITMVYPERSFEEHRAYLASVAGSRTSRLDGFRRHGSGVALTFVTEARNRDTAMMQAHQRAVSMWPSHPARAIEVTALGPAG